VSGRIIRTFGRRDFKWRITIVKIAVFERSTIITPNHSSADYGDGMPIGAPAGNGTLHLFLKLRGLN
jgi:hypothetical protein